MEISENDVRELLGAMESVNRGVSHVVTLKGGWTVLVGPGVPIALHVPDQWGA